MAQSTVLKVHISCQKCKKKLLKAVSAVQGVDKIEVDEAKGTLTVTGNANPYEIVVRTRKAGKYAEVVSIGPPPGPPKQDSQKKPEEKKPEEKKPEEKVQVHNPFSCPVCERMTVVHYVERYQDSAMGCSVM